MREIGFFMVKNGIQGLEQKIDTLIGECRRLVDENRNLRDSKDSLLAERTQLQEKNKLARSRLEGIVEKLRTLDEQ